MLINNPQMKEIFTELPIVSFRRHRNLRDMFTSFKANKQEEVKRGRHLEIINEMTG